MYHRLQNAQKLFAKISKRSPTLQSSTHTLYAIHRYESHSNSLCSRQISSEYEDTVSWTSNISSLVRKNQPKEAVSLFKKMLISKWRPNYVTVLSVMQAVSQLECIGLGLGVHCFAIKSGFDFEMAVVTAMIGVYSVLYDMENAVRLFEEARDKDVVLWSAMISACVRSGLYDEALDVFRRMQIFGVEPNYVSVLSVLPACVNLRALCYGKQVHGFSIKSVFSDYVKVQNSLIHMYAKCGKLGAALFVFTRMHTKDLISWRSMIRGYIENECPEGALTVFCKMLSFCIELDEAIVIEVIGASSQADEINVGKGIHGLVLKRGVLGFVSVVTALLHMYARFGEVGSACTLFDGFKQRDLIAWSSMISVYAQNGKGSDAFGIFRLMQLAGEKPNEVTFVSLLQACSSVAAQEIGESIHAYVTKAGFLSNEYLMSALIDMYCKFGRIGEGKALFDQSPSDDFICWSSMINGYGINGLGDEALECFSSMLCHGIKPNDVVFVSVLSACSHCGLEYEGWNWFYAMKEKYNITPKIAHFACMVDLLSRQGNIEEAFEFVNSMPIKPDKRIWGALLAGCRKTDRCSEITELVAKKLINLDPKNTSYYVLLSNFYAEQGRWKEVERLRKLLGKYGLKKEMAYSMF